MNTEWLINLICVSQIIDVSFRIIECVFLIRINVFMKDFIDSFIVLTINTIVEIERVWNDVLICFDNNNLFLLRRNNQNRQLKRCVWIWICSQRLLLLLRIVNCFLIWILRKRDYWKKVLKLIKKVLKTRRYERLLRRNVKLIIKTLIIIVWIIEEIIFAITIVYCIVDIQHVTLLRTILFVFLFTSLFDVIWTTCDIQCLSKMFFIIQFVNELD